MRPTIQTSLLLLANTVAGYQVPDPPGKYDTTLTTGPLVDHSRNERALMLSVFQPATCSSTMPVSYMPNKTAEYQGPFLRQQFNISADFTPVFLEARLPVCPDNSDGCSPLENTSILLFSPGYGIPRLYYSALASAIASEGFIVITIDHPGEINIVTYPDGHSVYGPGPSNPTPDEYVEWTRIRLADISFLIDQLSNATAMAGLLPQRGHRKFPSDRVAMLGHSLGGVTAVVAASEDPRVRGAINWDGSIFNSLPALGLSTPMMYVSEANTTDPTWVAAWPKLKGPKLWLEVANTTHMSFSDAPTLLQAAGQDVAAFADLLGTIKSYELVRILTTYTAAWMEGAFNGNVGGPLLEGKQPERFPEVSVVTKSNY